MRQRGPDDGSRAVLPSRARDVKSIQTRRRPHRTRRVVAAAFIPFLAVVCATYALVCLLRARLRGPAPAAAAVHRRAAQPKTNAISDAGRASEVELPVESIYRLSATLGSATGIIEPFGRGKELSALAPFSLAHYAGLVSIVVNVASE
eukprot:CAMPEP_0194326936 /NCGR_PEP_ID=MMETSP0171-20130528/38925_1 /TAXON_ID=218684 /ORGANISM="Corethron pennatum, Strain L29A3" /LENGTH=147 /DNA_ID=CAMNT_0039086695 /DNA_START=25 /DNA_END=468 /DNA_ORIENTATION=+